MTSSAPAVIGAPDGIHHGRPGRASLLVLAVLAAVGCLPAPAAAVMPGRMPVTRIEYEGTLLYEAHFRRPGDVHPYHSRAVYMTNGGGARLDWTTWQDGDSALAPESFLITGGIAFHRDAPGQPWRVYSGERARLARLQAVAGLPAALATLARDEDDRHAVLTIDHGRTVRYTRFKAHPRLGDVRDSVAFEYPESDPIPVAMSMALYSRDSNWRLAQRRVSWSSVTNAESLLSAPSVFEAAPSSEDDDTLATVPPFMPVADGIWSLDLTDIDSRTLVVELDDGLAVIEIAVGSANGERIVDALHQRWPGRPIRYAFFSHYHPHYAGGLRALIAEGATIVTTPGNEAFVRSVAARRFGLEPDRLAKHPVPPKIVTFKDRYELDDSRNRLVAIDYGERSQHTDEFVLFWFPRQKLMFETEQGWSSSHGALRAGRRAKNLLAWIADQKLDVDTIVQSWPMRDNAAKLTRAQLDSLVTIPR